jgi:CRP-like cAMP-binding protein
MPLDGDEDSWPGWELPRWELPPMDIMYWPGLQEAGETRCYGPGETVIPAGRPPDCVQVIDEGLVRVTAPAGRGGDAFLRACGPGEVLGEELLLPLGGRPGGRRIGAVALTACTTLAVSRAAVRACLSDRPQLWEGLAQDLIRRVAEDEERIMRLACDPVGVRLAWLLVRLVRSCDAVEDDGALGLPVNLSDADLALWIGAGRTSVETALKEWRSRGVVARRHGKLVITNPDPLIKMADIPADRRAVTQPRTPAWRLARPAGRHGAAVERPAGRHVGATAARTGNHAARGGRPGCGRPRAALAGASAWRCRPPSPRTREPSERARTAWARYPAGAPAPSQGFGQRGRAREYPADLPNQANAGRAGHGTPAGGH